MKKRIAILAGIVLAVLLTYFIVTGFEKNTSVFIADYTVSEDGTQMAITAWVASSVGYIRDVDVKREDGGMVKLTFYSAFGGINGSIGAKNTFTIPLDEYASTISIYRGADGYEDILVKDSDGMWMWK